MTYIIPNFSKARVLIVGDVMLDRYLSGAVNRISPEAPVSIVNINKEWECPGGAANVALNVAALGAQVSLLSICGDDLPAKILQEKLTAHQVNHHLIKDPQQKTIVKLRVLGSNQQLLRLDFEAQAKPGVNAELQQRFSELVKQVDVVILSDYAKGTLREPAELIALANAAQVPVLVDPKSQDFSIYAGAYLITPNLKEFFAVVGECLNEKQLLEKGQELIKKLKLPVLLVTRSEQGATLFQQEKAAVTIPAQQQEVYDVSGAGDTMIAVIASCLAANASLEDAVKLANLAAGISVQKLNAATVRVSELRREIWRQKFWCDEKHIMSPQELLIAVQDAKGHGEKIVMTNGCFDLLHPGHVTYLAQAKQLGDRLIVAVNDDDSVRLLNKGANRPFNNLHARMQVLSGLRSVDWIVAFSEETPEELINTILPDVLVKGGDYQVEQIAGHKAVLANNGEVIILDFVPGYSTTSMIENFLAKT
jgi:D-beta-D-heptose 7-phosphate kinase/D-beta-D-heptose 1-phosphate adenosyltransferase